MREFHREIVDRLTYLAKRIGSEKQTNKKYETLCLCHLLRADRSSMRSIGDIGTLNMGKLEAVYIHNFGANIF